MKRSTIISLALIVAGFVVEYFYMGSEQIFFKVKLWLIGVIFILCGVFGLLIYTIFPYLNKDK